MIREQNLLSERGRAFIDERTNQLIINDIAQNINEINRLTTLFDKPIPQIHITAYIVTMSDESVSELGVKWGYTGSSSQLLKQFDLNLGSVNSTNTIAFNLVKRSSHLLNLELSALEAENQ